MIYLKKFNESVFQEYVDEVEDILTELRDDGFVYGVELAKESIIGITILKSRTGIFEIDYNTLDYRSSRDIFNTSLIENCVGRCIKYIRDEQVMHHIRFDFNELDGYRYGLIQFPKNKNIIVMNIKMIV